MMFKKALKLIAPSFVGFIIAALYFVAKEDNDEDK